MNNEPILPTQAFGFATWNHLVVTSFIYQTFVQYIPKHGDLEPRQQKENMKQKPFCSFFATVNSVRNVE